MSGLILNSLGMAYGNRVLFTGLSARLVPGEVLVVTGSNGSGKSTLLRIVAGLLRPLNGSVERPNRVGFAAPDVNLYTELTGHENLTFFAGFRKAGADVSDALRRVGLPSRSWNQLVASYSTGMRQRLKLALSLLGRPELLVWDEPEQGLDSAGGDAIEGLLAAHRGAGGMVVLATNDEAEARRWGVGGLGLRLSND